MDGSLVPRIVCGYGRRLIKPQVHMRVGFTSLFTAVILDGGITCESRPLGFDSVKLLSWKYLSKDMTVIQHVQY